MKGNEEMIGQAKALIPASIGIITLLLAGITGIIVTSGEQQATRIGETRAVTLEQYSHQNLETEFRMDAEKAVQETGLNIVADLAVDISNAPAPQLVAADASLSDRG
jgi:hypothetical protein